MTVKKRRYVLKNLRAREAEMLQQLEDLRGEIQKEEARQMQVQGDGLGALMVTKFRREHPDVNLDDLTPDEVFTLLLNEERTKMQNAAKRPAESSASESSVHSAVIDQKEPDVRQAETMGEAEV